MIGSGLEDVLIDAGFTRQPRRLVASAYGSPGVAEGDTIHRTARRLNLARGRPWILLASEAALAAQFGGRLLRLVNEARARSDPGLRQLGPDRIDPWRRVEELSGRATRERCPRCGGPIRSRGQGDDNRVAYWCPALTALTPSPGPSDLSGCAPAKRDNRIQRERM